MSTPFVGQSLQAQVQYQVSLDTIIKKLATDAVGYLRDYALFLQIWPIIGQFSGSLDPNEQIPRLNLPPGPFVQQNMPFASVNTWSADLVAIHNAITAAISDINAILGADNTVV